MKKSKKITSVLLILFLLAAFLGCSIESSLVGEYIGTSGSYLKLRENGSCVYSEDDSTGSGVGAWHVEDGVIYIDVNNLGYTIYGDVSNFDGGILMKSDGYSWNDEYFIKQD
ncbi:MAG: hypothetical protein IJW62_02600 [Clostridia bacterium]|nr:hypothetical protein [Clostridia bacterium]